MAFEFFLQSISKIPVYLESEWFSANLVSQFVYLIGPYECRAGRLFPDRLRSTRPALHMSAFLMVFYRIARPGPYGSCDK